VKVKVREAKPTAGFFGELGELYRQSLKPKDIVWNLYVARPLAAFSLLFLRRSPVTPNQLSFLGLFVFFGVGATLLTWRGPWGFFVAALILQLSYVFDCADGQLARLKGQTSSVGAYLDFLIDEVKALLLVGSCAARLWLEGGDVRWLEVGIGGVALVSVATSLTTFVRREEFAGHAIEPGTDTAGPTLPTGFVRRAVWLVIKTMKLVVHYPSWITFVAIAGLTIPGFDPTLGFLVPFLIIYLLYAGRTALGVFVRLAKPSFYSRP